MVKRLGSAIAWHHSMSQRQLPAVGTTLT